MQHNLAILGSRPLGEICLPGAFKLELGTNVGGIKSNVITQTLSIYDQLEHSVRWFDIRPFLLRQKTSFGRTESNWYCGHFSDLKSPLNWQGGCGATIDEVVADVNRFTSEHRELVILDISHITLLECHVAVMTGMSGGIQGVLTSGERHELLTKLAGIQNRFHAPAGKQLETFTLDAFIGQRQPAVLVLFGSDSDDLFDEAELTKREFYRSGRYAVEKHFVTRMQTDKEAVVSSLPVVRWLDPMNNPNSVLRLADAHQAQEFPFTLQELAKNGMQAGVIVIDKVEKADLLTLCLAVSLARLSPHELVVVYGGICITDGAARQRVQDAINARRALDITNSQCGSDPWELTVKSLAVVYWHDGWVKARFGTEGTALHFERDFFSIKRDGVETKDQALYYDLWRAHMMRGGPPDLDSYEG
ncbi:PLC-like phosphodiesterase [Mycena alexandri]|uniref:PLC-like phosphodiesterase n=1 Tax=Mycena alexandri TaxID=1745969 RepID=A0AAD6TDA6_9AGAR|nr:PLC-like phosphodiesterase [Mycena alexandri]